MGTLIIETFLFYCYFSNSSVFAIDWSSSIELVRGGFLFED